MHWSQPVLLRSCFQSCWAPPPVVVASSCHEQLAVTAKGGLTGFVRTPAWKIMNLSYDFILIISVRYMCVCSHIHTQGLLGNCHFLRLRTHQVLPPSCLLKTVHQKILKPHYDANQLFSCSIERRYIVSIGRLLELFILVAIKVG